MTFLKKTSLKQNITAGDRQWFVIDANQQRLGKLAALVANKLRGKDEPSFTPHSDCGNYVVVLNAEKIAVSGNKESDKMYYRHSGYLGHLKEESLSVVRAKTPERILRDAISGMLPKNKLRNKALERLTLVIGGENPHAAQKPTELTLN